MSARSARREATRATPRAGLLVPLLLALGAVSCNRHRGPEIPELLATTMARPAWATRLCNVKVDGLRDVRVSKVRTLGQSSIGSARASVEGKPTGPAGAPATCSGTVTFVYNWTWVKGRSGPLELSISHLGVSDRAVWVADVVPGKGGTHGPPLARPGSAPGPTPFPVGAEVTSSLEARDAELSPNRFAHDYLLDLATTEPVAIAVVDNADAVKGIAPTFAPDVSVLRDGKVQRSEQPSPTAFAFQPPSPGRYVVRIAFNGPGPERAGTYTLRSAYGVRPLDLIF
jgi:hypothetical protein